MSTQLKTFLFLHPANKNMKFTTIFCSFSIIRRCATRLWAIRDALTWVCLIHTFPLCTFLYSRSGVCSMVFFNACLEFLGSNSSRWMPLLYHPAWKSFSCFDNSSSIWKVSYRCEWEMMFRTLYLWLNNDYVSFCKRLENVQDPFQQKTKHFCSKQNNWQRRRVATAVTKSHFLAGQESLQLQGWSQRDSTRRGNYRKFWQAFVHQRATWAFFLFSPQILPWLFIGPCKGVFSGGQPSWAHMPITKSLSNTHTHTHAHTHNAHTQSRPQPCHQWVGAHTHTHTHPPTHMHTHTHTHPPTHPHAHTHSHTHPHPPHAPTHPPTHSHAHTHPPTHKHTPTPTPHTHPPTYTHAHTHAHTHKHPPTHQSTPWALHHESASDWLRD